MLNGYLTKVNLGQDLLTHINLLLAVVVMVMVRMVGATMPFRTTVVMTVFMMTVMTVFMMIVMIVMVRPFFLCWCIHICGFLALFKLQ